MKEPEDAEKAVAIISIITGKSTAEQTIEKYNITKATLDRWAFEVFTILLIDEDDLDEEK